MNLKRIEDGVVYKVSHQTLINLRGSNGNDYELMVVKAPEQPGAAGSKNPLTFKVCCTGAQVVEPRYGKFFVRVGSQDGQKVTVSELAHVISYQGKFEPVAPTDLEKVFQQAPALKPAPSQAAASFDYFVSE